MPSATHSLPPDEREGPSPGAGNLATELKRLRERLATVEQIDAQTTELLARLAETRAAASLKIATAISRIERAISDRETRQRSSMTEVLDELTAAHERATGLAHVAGELEAAFAGLQARIQPVVLENAPDLEQEPAPPLRVVHPVIRGQSAPLPLSSLFIDIEAVPSVTMALSLQRFIAGLPGVVSALTREYAADIVRFETQVTGHLTGLEIERLSRGGLRLIEGHGDGLRFVLFDPESIAPPG